MHSIRRALLGLAALATIALPVRAQGTLSGFLNVDNAFTAFLGTNPALTGVAVASGANWTVTNSFSGVSLQAGQDYWFQVRATDVGVISGLLATLDLGGGTHVFTNGGTRLVSNTTDWVAGTTDWLAGAQSLVSYGANGVGPWGTYTLQAATAQWVWTADNCTDCTRYFSTRISAVPAVVPEPRAALLLLAGVAALPLARRRRRA